MRFPASKITKTALMLALMAGGAYGVSTLTNQPAEARKAEMTSIAINEAGEKKVRALAQSIIDQQRNALSGKNSELITTGDITIERAASYYAVMLPEMVHKTTIQINDKTRVNEVRIGMIGLNVMPTANDKEWKMTLALPSPIRTFKNGVEQTQITIGKQNFVGTWNEEIDSFSNIKLSYDDIKASAKNTKSPIIHISKLTMDTDITQNDQKRWSGPAKINLSDISISSKDGDTGASIKNFVVTSAVNDYDHDIYMKLVNAVNSANKQQAMLPTSEQLLPLFLDFADSMNSAFEITGLKMNDPKGDKDFELDKAYMSFDLSGIRKKELAQKISFGWDDFKSDAEGSELAPESGNFDLSLDKLPLQPLIDLGTQLQGAAGGAQNNMTQMAMMGALFSLPQVLAQAGTKIELNDTYIKHDDYEFEIDGDVTAEAEAAMGLVAEAEIKARGIDRVRQGLIKQKENARPAQQAQIDQTIARLDMMDKIMKDDGGNKKSAKIVFDKQGQTLINGKPMAEVMAGAQ